MNKWHSLSDCAANKLQQQDNKRTTSVSYTNTGDFVRVRKGIHVVRGDSVHGYDVTVSYTMDKGRSVAGKNYFRLGVRMLSHIIAELGWKHGDYIDVHEGIGTNASKLLLTVAERPNTGYKLTYAGVSRARAEEQAARGTPPNAYLAIGVSGIKHHELPSVVHTAAVVRGRPFNNELLIDMPAWFKPIVDDHASMPEHKHDNNTPSSMRRGPGRPRKNASA